MIIKGKTNIFKKLDMVDRVPEEGCDQNHPTEKEMQEGKVVVKEALQIARRDMKAFLNAKKYGKTIVWERLEISSRKLEIARQHFMQRRHNKGQKCYGPDRSRRY